MSTDTSERLEEEPVTVRQLVPEDLEWVVRIDAQHGGRRRTGYYERKLEESRRDTGIHVSLAAELDGEPVGFLIARVYYGEFGAPEPMAILDSIGIASHEQGHGVGTVLLDHLSRQLSSLGISRVQTQVAWTELHLMGFFARAGFSPAPRLCLELALPEPFSGETANRSG
jgi:GNAT superfamily N-acetyltransferase